MTNLETYSNYEDVHDLVIISAYLRRRKNDISRIHTSSYTGLMWMNDILNGHQERCQQIFRLKRLFSLIAL